MADYRLTENTDVIRTADWTLIPNDPNNVDRIAYETWLALGGVPDEYEAPLPPIPEYITRRQFNQLLANNAFISQSEALASITGVIAPAILAILEGLPTSDERFAAKMYFGSEANIARDHDVVAAIADHYAWSDNDVDIFFTAAAIL